MDEGDRGVMRTYSIREQRLGPDITEYDVDFVVHGVNDGGQAGPAASWAASAAVGDTLVLVGPTREGNDAHNNAGIAFGPGQATEAVIIGDETAAPAIGRILGDIADGRDQVAGLTRGVVFLELPTPGDVDALRADFLVPDGFDVHFIARGDGERGEEIGQHLAKCVQRRSGAQAAGELGGADGVMAGDGDLGGGGVASGDDGSSGDELIWEQPDTV